jgi:hypothetical protein
MSEYTSKLRSKNKPFLLTLESERKSIVSSVGLNQPTLQTEPEAADKVALAELLEAEMDTESPIVDQPFKTQKTVRRWKKALCKFCFKALCKFCCTALCKVCCKALCNVCWQALCKFCFKALCKFCSTALCKVCCKFFDENLL